MKQILVLLPIATNQQTTVKYITDHTFRGRDMLNNNSDDSLTTLLDSRTPTHTYR